MSSRLTFPPGYLARRPVSSGRLATTTRVQVVYLLAMLISMAFVSGADAQSLVLNGGSADASASAADSSAVEAPSGTHTVTFQNAGSTTSETKTPRADSHAESKDSAPEPKAGKLVLKGGTSDSSSYEDALAIECPQPELTAEHNEQGIKTSCSARFVIDEMGKFTVRLVSSTGSQEVDDMALSTLRRWKFKPAQLNGKPVKSSRKIKIEFVIE